MDAQLETDVQTLRESFRRLVPKADTLAQNFYDLLFERFPHLLVLFEGVRFDEQRRKLMRALALIVRHIERPDFMRPYLQGLGALHLAYGVEADHYPAFGQCLVDALSQTAGKSWNAREEQAWRSAIRVISETMLAGADKVGR
jgi:hemoglobin-like flavoprotein